MFGFLDKIVKRVWGSSENDFYERIKMRSPLSDDDFIAACAITGDDSPLCISIRQIMSEQLAVPKEQLYPDDLWEDYYKACWFPLLSIEDFFFPLERQTKLKLSLKKVREAWNEELLIKKNKPTLSYITNLLIEAVREAIARTRNN